MDTVKTAAGNAGLRMLPGALTTRATLRVPCLRCCHGWQARASPALALLPRLAIRAPLAVLLLIIPSLHPLASNAFELHNHTVESDGNLTCQELTEYLAADHVDAFAITDHNTTSGQKKDRTAAGRKALSDQPGSAAWNIRFISGISSA